MRFGLVFLLLLAIAATTSYGIYSGRIIIPDEWNPWAPLKIEQPLNWLTRFKLMRASRDGESCLPVLAQAKMQYTTLPDRDAGKGCGYRDAVRVDATSLRIGAPLTLSCRSALALAMWEHHVVTPASLAHFGVAVARLEHSGSYACRGIYGRKDATLSRHATADALDISAFVLEDGRRVTVERGWGSDDARGKFLRDARDGACRVFDSVLGPEYNAAHRNHLHLDRGGFRVCR